MVRLRTTLIAAAAGTLAVLAAGWLSVAVTPRPAEANTCAASCRARHNQCRIATKGSARCDAELQACLRRCLAGRQR